ncbi:MAG: SAM-dependent chlorinase/fluorinase, partial [Candidatus Hydrogenedentes bacterium]|nr:SAM-dependent chlorinase/fluorinase [Candidatus Hydrogenedentota bacterium]
MCLAVRMQLRRTQMLLLLICCGVFSLASFGAEDAPQVSGLAVMLTDYGTDSIYVGIIKGAMYSAFPEIRIDAITNGIPPYDI